MTCRFRRAEHLRKRADFERVYQGGSKRSGGLMTLFALPGMDARLGIAATKKVGPAVARNRAKRLIREVFRHHKPVGLDVIVVPRREILEAPYARLEAEFCTLLERRRRPASD